MKHTLALLVVNRPTVLSHISGLISRRFYNIESIAAGPTEDPKVTRITLVVECEEHEIDQVIMQISKLVDVIKVTNLTSVKSITRELALIKVKAVPEKRTDIVDIVNIFRAKIVDVNRETMVIELTGETDKIDALLDVLQEHGIVEIVRTGKIALSRGPESAKEL
ncbi:acetolactate synthase small subunit [Calderihabitans maritimus]|uniref:Acetolactate synthase small subunit n=1 Tax=Calderihabitans maritimus TaxID=1246530 RepID=A0A1Z5HWG8_9FIRM|nr:acetolactate synthase small subunit [Calderihabitans maritimus]GAW93681.1 acetolactate synthase 3 regulatory subunit [Calderihabitans maritimus]